MIAALYIDDRGPYPTLLGPENCYGIGRDARLYSGPGPVVAHPPCGPWGKLRHLYQGGEHECAIRAVEQVRALGGVLEHPAHSRLWGPCVLPRPGEPADSFGGYTIEVCQCDFGHVARKRTWLYLVRVPRERVHLPAAREPTHWASGSRNAPRGPVPFGIKVCSAQQRRRTPLEFARWLVTLAGYAARK
jgi:hypothetical protein